MKRLLYILPLLAVFALSGCTKKYYTEVKGTDNGDTWIMTNMYTVLASDWKWNEELKRYDVVFENGDIDDNLFDFGSIIGERVFDFDGGSTLMPLPTTETFQGTNGTYSIVTSAEFNYFGGNDADIVFFIQSSDIVSAEQHLDKYTFKTTFVWPSETGWQDSLSKKGLLRHKGEAVNQ